MTPQTVRKYWSPGSGRVELRYNWDIINRDSVVLITAAEYVETVPASSERRFLGAAPITVQNIAPHGPPDANNGVTFVVDIPWDTPINFVTDITVLDSNPLKIETYTPYAPNNTGLRMQYQESKLWCWIAVATSINHFYDPNSKWTQCAVMTDVGHRLNSYPADSGACPTQETVNDNPDLKAALADPFNSAAEFILDDPRWGVDVRYLKSGRVKDPLVTTENWADDYGPETSLAQITAEINAGRPVAVDIAWFPDNVNQHVVTIAGVSGDYLLLLDPVHGTSVMRFENFPGLYWGGAKILSYSFTKSA